MKFVAVKEHRYWWPIRVKVPNPEPRAAGTFLDQSFKAQFVSIPKDEAMALEREIRVLPETERAGREHALLERVLVGWDDNIVDEEGKPVPFSIEQFRELMQSSWFRIGAYQGWNESVVGEEARRGN